ncbi:MAG: hypothetical protein FD130_738 [Halothiobacillaceae bacterium]|nr:MAG: hypothetical protein FD130_738 [Halothiobacillaceae bacterium]
MAAGVIPDPFDVAVDTLGDMATERRGATRDQRRHGLVVMERQAVVGEEVAWFLSYLACEKNVAAATQNQENQTLNALLFLYKSLALHLRLPLRARRYLAEFGQGINNRAR